MNFKFIILWTDIFMYLLIGLMFFLAVWVRRHPHLRQPFKHVGQSRLAMISAVILLTFFSVGLLDSIHIRHTLHSNEKPHNAQYSV